MSALLRFKYASKVFLTTLICVISLQYLTVYAEALPNHKELPSESFRAMLDENPEVELLMRESIGIAARINPDRETNPVQSLDEIYDFIDYSLIILLPVCHGISCRKIGMIASRQNVTKAYSISTG